MMYTYPATNPLNLKKIIKIEQNTPLTLKTLDPRGHIEKWWDKQVAKLAQYFSNKYPNATLADWQSYLKTFIENTLRPDDMLSGEEGLSKEERLKENYLAMVFALLNAKTEKQFSSIEKVRANWRFDHNKTLAQNITQYFSHREFLANVSVTSDVFDVTRSFDKMYDFLGLENIAEAFPLPAKAYQAFAKLVGNWPVLYKNFMDKQSAGTDFNEAINARDITLEALDPKGEFKQWWQMYGKQLDAVFSEIDKKTQQMQIRAYLDATYPDQADKETIYQTQSDKLKSSYYAAFFQFLLKPILGTERFLELKQIRVADLTDEQNEELQGYEDQFTFTLRLTQLLRQSNLTQESPSRKESVSSEGDSIASSASSFSLGDSDSDLSVSEVQVTPTVQSNIKPSITRDQVIEAAIAEFKFIDVTLNNDPSAWTAAQLSTFHQYLYTVMPSGKFRIQEMIDQYAPNQSNLPLYEHYNMFQKDLYLGLMEKFMQKIYSNFGIQSSADIEHPLKATLYEVYLQFHEDVVQATEQAQHQEKTNFLDAVKAVYKQAFNSPLKKLTARNHFKLFMDIINKAELNLIHTFYSKKDQLRSPAEHDAFREAYMKVINEDAKLALELEKPSKEKVLRASTTFLSSKDKLERAFSGAQKATTTFLSELGSKPAAVAQVANDPRSEDTLTRPRSGAFLGLKAH